MLDINLFRTNPEIIYESQKRRFADTGIVDQVIELDNQWKELRATLDNLNRAVNLPSKLISGKFKSGIKVEPGELEEVPVNLLEQADTIKESDLSGLTISQLKNFSKSVSQMVKNFNDKIKNLETEIAKKLNAIGNIIHDSVPVSDNEDNNQVHRVVGDVSERTGLKNHVELMGLIGGLDTGKGADIAGNRGYFMKGKLVQLHLALVNYSINFLTTRGYTPLYTPVFMNKSTMSRVAQLEQFDEELYKVSEGPESEDKYLIATSEQPIAAYHMGEWIESKQLPICYAGFSSCFRKEVGKHGKDTLGIFRVHQFEKIEQFCITEPEKSWAMWELMIKTSEEFYQGLGIPYRVISIVSGALNNAAAAKYDLEGYFPASNTFRELVSCSNCTDYQARSMETRLQTNDPKDKKYVHMLNSTLCATTRTLCILCELGQTADGIKVPKVLVPYTGFDFIPYAK